MAKNIKYRLVFFEYFSSSYKTENSESRQTVFVSCHVLDLKNIGGGYFSINYSLKPNSTSSVNHTASGYKGWQNKEPSRSLRSSGLHWNLHAMENNTSGWRPNISTFLLNLFQSKYDPMLFAASVCPPYVCALNALHSMGLWLVELPPWTNTLGSTQKMKSADLATKRRTYRGQLVLWLC